MALSAVHVIVFQYFFQMYLYFDFIFLSQCQENSKPGHSKDIVFFGKLKCKKESEKHSGWKHSGCVHCNTFLAVKFFTLMNVYTN